MTGEQRGQCIGRIERRKQKGTLFNYSSTASSKKQVVLQSLNFTYTPANGKRQIQAENFSKQKMSRQNKPKTIRMDKKFLKASNLCVEIMNSERQVKGKLGHVVQIHVWRLT